MLEPFTTAAWKDVLSLQESECNGVYQKILRLIKNEHAKQDFRNKPPYWVDLAITLLDGVVEEMLKWETRAAAYGEMLIRAGGQAAEVPAYASEHETLLLDWLERQKQYALQLLAETYYGRTPTDDDLDAWRNSIDERGSRQTSRVRHHYSEKRALWNLQLEIAERGDGHRKTGDDTPHASPSTGGKGAPPRKKRSTEWGEARLKLISALTLHHNYAGRGGLSQEPINSNELARQSGVSTGSASAFFKEAFGGHVKYRHLCGDFSRLIDRIRSLNQEFTNDKLYGSTPPCDVDVAVAGEHEGD